MRGVVKPSKGDVLNRFVEVDEQDGGAGLERGQGEVKKQDEARLRNKTRKL